MAQDIVNLAAETGKDIVSDEVGSQLTLRSTATEGVPLRLDRGTTTSSPTVALLRLAIASTASAPVFELQEQAFVSATTILFTTGATAGTGAVRVKIADTYKWIPILVDGSVTAAAR